jgi:hypothetical protein
MELTKDLVRFKGKDGAVVTGQIINVATIQERAATFYRISYADGDKNEYQLDLVYDPADAGTVSFKNQPELVWKRTGAST